MLKLISKLRDMVRVPSIEDRELAYLNSASDRYDLEYRQAQVDRGLFRRPQFSLSALPSMR